MPVETTPEDKAPLSLGQRFATALAAGILAAVILSVGGAAFQTFVNMVMGYVPFTHSHLGEFFRYVTTLTIFGLFFYIPVALFFFQFVLAVFDLTPTSQNLAGNCVIAGLLACLPPALLLHMTLFQVGTHPAPLWATAMLWALAGTAFGLAYAFVVKKPRPARV